MRRILLILAVLIPFVALSQTTVGKWKTYPRYTNVTKMVQTPDKVYFVSGNSLYSYDKNTQQSYSYTSLNKLSDNNISNIYYNIKGKYLVVTYPTGNIDLLYDNGEVVNVPVVKDAVLTYVPTINDVAFLDDYIYLATKFGLIVYDTNLQKVKTSGVYDKEISLVTCVGDYVLVDHNHALYYLHKDGRFETFDNFALIKSGYWIDDVEGLSNNKLLFRGTNKSVYLLDFDFETNSCASTVLDASGSSSNLIYGKDAYYYIVNNVIYSVSFAGDKATHSNIPTDSPTNLPSQTISIWDNADEVWAGNNKGIANYNIKDGNLTILKDKIKPTSFTVDYPFYITSDINGKVYVSNHGESKWASPFVGGTWFYSNVNTIDGNKIEDITAAGLESFNGASPNYQRKDGKPYSSFNLAFDPEDPETYYLSTYFDGIYKIKDGKQIAHYYEGNSSLLAIYGCRVFALGFDKDNNLWCVNEVNPNSNSPALHFLPAEARKKETTTVEDWTPINLDPFIGGRDVRLLICKKSNMIFICDGSWSTPLVAYDTKGTYSDTSDDEFYLWDSFVDQDGKNYDPDRTSALCEDEQGRVWIGTTNGIIEITDPTKALDPTMTVKRLKLKNDNGVGYSGYLLDALQVTSIAIDENNRKWIGTLTNGVYYVDEDGERIFNHFTSDNSYHPGGITYNVYVHPISGSVYMGTEYGLVEYNSTSSPAKEDYNDVYVYPNPVKPDYTGWISIKNLMDNSYVKITDMSGNILLSTRSAGGIITWDGCDDKGLRVKAGVYKVYASQTENDPTPAMVTKIIMVN